MTTTYFSSLAFVTATVLHLLAFCMHSIEWAAARRIEARNVDPAPERGLAASTATAAGTSAHGPGRREGTGDPGRISIPRTFRHWPRSTPMNPSPLLRQGNGEHGSMEVRGCALPVHLSTGSFAT